MNICIGLHFTTGNSCNSIIVNIECILYTVYCMIYVQCTVYTVHCTSYMQNTCCNLQCTTALIHYNMITYVYSLFVTLMSYCINDLFIVFTHTQARTHTHMREHTHTHKHTYSHTHIYIMFIQCNILNLLFNILTFVYW